MVLQHEVLKKFNSLKLRHKKQQQLMVSHLKIKSHFIKNAFLPIPPVDYQTLITTSLRFEHSEDKSKLKKSSSR